MNANRRSVTAVLVGILLMAAALAASVQKEARTMNAGRWQGDYIDVDGHRGRLELTITKTGPTVGGTFVFSLATEDQPERYGGSVSGRIDGTAVLLQLETDREATIVCRLTLAEPAAFAEQAVYGTVDPTPKLRLGGGVLTAWRFKQ